MIRILSTALAAALLLAGPVAAETEAPAAPVCDQGVKKPKALRLRSGDMAKDMTLQIILPMAFQDEALSAGNLAKGDRGCPRGAFQAGGRTFEIFGQDGKAGGAARWAVSGDTAVYLANTDINSAELGIKLKGYLLVTEVNGEVRVLGGLQKLPLDAALPGLFADALTGKIPPFVGYDRKTKSVNVFVG